MKEDVILIFSKDRALQLDLCLHSLKKWCINVEQSSIKVLYTTSNPNFQQGYEILKGEHKDIELIKEVNFKEDVLRILADKKYVLFVTDDTILCDIFSMNEMKELLDSNNNAVGFSLRLGKNTTYCYPVDKEQPFPGNYQQVSERVLIWDWQRDGKLDFAYPAEISSSFYPIQNIFNLIHYGTYNNPNELEGMMANNLWYLDKTKLLCFETSVAFACPMNRVQNVAKDNRVSTKKDHSPENLNRLYLGGKRISPDKFFEFIPNACHVEVSLL